MDLPAHKFRFTGDFSILFFVWRMCVLMWVWVYGVCDCACTYEPTHVGKPDVNLQCHFLVRESLNGLDSPCPRDLVFPTPSVLGSHYHAILYGSNYWTQVFIITSRTLWVPLSPGPWTIFFLIFYFNISYVIRFTTLNFFSWALKCFLLYFGNFLISVIFLLKSIWGFAIHQSFIYETVPRMQWFDPLDFRHFAWSFCHKPKFSSFRFQTRTQTFIFFSTF